MCQLSDNSQPKKNQYKMHQIHKMNDIIMALQRTQPKFNVNFWLHYKQFKIIQKTTKQLRNNIEIPKMTQISLISHKYQPTKN